MRASRATFLALLLLAPAASAQLTDKQASKELKGATKEALKIARDGIKDARDVALDAIKAYEDELKESGFSEPATLDLFVALNGFVGSVTDAAREQAVVVGEAATSLLGQIDDPDVGLGLYPEDFQYGTGRLLDDTRDALADAAEKALAQVFKRLGKTAKLLAKKNTDILLTVVRRPLAPGLLDVGPNHEGTTFSIDAPQLTLDLAITVSSTSVTGDGLAFLAGVGSEAVVNVHATFATETLIVAPDGNTDRWSATFGLVEPLDEGNVVADAVAEAGGARDTLVIAVR
jgi:hypothetical protein